MYLITARSRSLLFLFHHVALRLNTQTTVSIPIEEQAFQHFSSSAWDELAVYVRQLARDDILIWYKSNPSRLLLPDTIANSTTTQTTTQQSKLLRHQHRNGEGKAIFFINTMSQPGTGGQDPPRNPGPYPSRKVKLKKGDTKKGPTPAANVEELDAEEGVTFRGGDAHHFQSGWPLRSGWPNSGSSDGCGSETSCSSTNETESSHLHNPSPFGPNEETTTLGSKRVAGTGSTLSRHPYQSNFGAASQRTPTTLPGPNTGRGPTVPRRDVSRPMFSPASRAGRFSAATQVRHGPMRVGETKKSWGGNAP